MTRPWILAFLFLIPQLYCINSYPDTIKSNNPLKDDGSLLVSGDGTFALGFFSPGKSTDRYVGIWYNKIRQQTVVWVANRDTPVLHNSSGVLSIDKTGNLFLSAVNLSTPVWSTNVSISTSGNQFRCRLSNSGNLELLHDEIVVWQSFDHPTNTIISRMKLGLDRKANLKRFVTSWKSKDDPGTGEFMLKLDDTELPEMIFQHGSKRLWRTGPWIGGGWVGIPQMSTTSFFLNISFVNDPNEVYLVYTVNDASILSTMVVNESGVLQRLAWHEADSQWSAFWTFPVDECEYYGKCGAYGYCDPQITEEFECSCLPGFEPKVSRDWFLRDGSAGCVRKKEAAAVEAECGGGDGFFKLVKAKLPATGVARVHKSIVGVEACGEECLKNCSCTAYASGAAADDGGECVTWHGELVDTRVFTNGGWDLYVRINGVELAKLYSSSRKARNKKVVIIATSICAIIGIGVLALCSVLIIKRRRDRERKEGEICFTSGNVSTMEGSTKDETFDEGIIDGNLNLFDFNTIVKATNNFSISNTLGEGGFGVVYKGQLKNGKTIAVKRLARNSDQGVEEFKTEVSLIVKLQHMNLVRLLGCCVQQHEKMLIYEYLPNKGLDSFIFDKEKSSQLDWERRFKIILGIARGMIYIHQDSRLRIIHRDLKASNILLDDEMNPKISDFGMARIFGRNQMEANTKRVVGTYGYMSPEYAMGGLFSTKSDVFSFGVLLLEVISGRKNSSYYEDETFNLIGYTWKLWKDEKSIELIDQVLGDAFNNEEALRCIHIGLLCVQEFPSDRPTMSDVAFMLCNEMPMPCPNQPAFIFNDRIKNVLHSSSGSTGANSNNGLTITQINAR